MKSRHILFVVLLFFLSMSFVSAANLPYSLDDAQQLVLSQVIRPSDFSPSSVFRISSTPLPAGTDIIDGRFQSFSLAESAYLAWIDPTPEMVYAHETFYVFLFADSSQLLVGQGWPIIHGDDWRTIGTASLPIDPQLTTGTVPSFSDTPILANKVVFRSPSIYLLPPTPPSPYTPAVKECPPGTIKKEVKNQEHGVFFTALAPPDPKIAFEQEAQRFTTAVHAAKFADWGAVTTPEALKNMLSDLSQKLEPGSTLAMYFSTHGAQLFDITLRHAKTGDELVIQDHIGEPVTAAQPNPLRYKDCFDAKNNIKRIPPCGELLIHDLSIPDGYYIVNMQRSGWCMSLADKCVKFNTDQQLGPILSCRKFLAANSCYGGAITSHHVKGLSAYAAAQQNEPAYGVAGPPGTKVESQYGLLFTQTLKGGIPLDPTKPDLDEPKPEFDAAHRAAAAILVPGKRIIIRYTITHPDGTKEIWARQQVVAQTPIEHSELGDKNCAQQILCIPAPPIVPDDNFKHIGCTDVDKNLFDALNECNKKCFRPPCKRVATQAGSCYECPPVTGPTHIIPPKLDSCGDLPFPPYYSNHQRCDNECPMGKCRPFKDRASNEDCWQCPSILEDLVSPPRIEKCADLSLPPFYKLQDQCNQACTMGPCRPTPLGGGCWECPSILEDLDKDICGRAIRFYAGNVMGRSAFSAPLTSRTSGGIHSIIPYGVYELAGDASGSVNFGSHTVDYNPSPRAVSRAVAYVPSFSTLQNGLVRACPSEAQMLRVATAMISITYKPQKPIEIVNTLIPALIIPTTHVLTQVIRPTIPQIGLAGSMRISAGLVTTLHPLTVLGSLVHNTAAFVTHSSGYAQQAHQATSFIMNSVAPFAFSMCGTGGASVLA